MPQMQTYFNSIPFACTCVSSAACQLFLFLFSYTIIHTRYEYICFWFASVHFQLIYAICFESFIFFMPDDGIWLCLNSMLAHTLSSHIRRVRALDVHVKYWCDFCRRYFRWCRRRCRPNVGTNAPKNTEISTDIRMFAILTHNSHPHRQTGIGQTQTYKNSICFFSTSRFLVWFSRLINSSSYHHCYTHLKCTLQFKMNFFDLNFSSSFEFYCLFLLKAKKGEKKNFSHLCCDGWKISCEILLLNMWSDKKRACL